MPNRPDPAPLEADDVKIVAAGTVAWAVGLLVLLVLKAAGTDVHDWWLWMCVSGAVLGALGVRFCARRRARLSAAGA